MKKYFNLLFYISLVFLVITCKKNADKTKEDTILEGQTSVLVDETLQPIIEDQVQIFESQYEAKINIEPKSEAEVILALTSDSSRIAILARTLNSEELNYFKSKKITPRITPFAKDAITLIANKNNKDTLIALKDITDFMKGSPSKVKGLVFDNPNSSTARYICEAAGLKNLPANGVFSFKTNNEAIEYVAQNSGMIGVVGINYIFEPSNAAKKNIANITVLNVLNTNDKKYYGPTQNNIAEGKYPLARDLFVVNCQGYAGLGMGLATFMSGEIGQRIILKSGLVPIRVPSRKIRIRNTISNDKK